MTILQQVASECNTQPPPRPCSPYLADEPPIALYPSLAEAFGSSDRALFLQQLNYWLARSRHHHDGRPWVYNTLEGWQRQLPWLSISTIQRIIRFFREQGIVLTANYNRRRTDSTLWYSIDSEALERYLGDSASPARARCRQVKPTGAGGQIDRAGVVNLTAPMDQRGTPENTGETRRSTESSSAHARTGELEGSTGPGPELGHGEGSPECRQAVTAKTREKGPDGTPAPAHPGGDNGPLSPERPSRHTAEPARPRERSGATPTAPNPKTGGSTGHGTLKDRACASRGARVRPSPPEEAGDGGLESSEWRRDSTSRPEVDELGCERREELARVLYAARDFYRELGDPHPERSAVALGNLFLRCGWGYERFYDLMLLTRQELRIAQGQQRPGEVIRNKGAYYYASVRHNLSRMEDYRSPSEDASRDESSARGRFERSRGSAPAGSAEARRAS